MKVLIIGEFKPDTERDPFCKNSMKENHHCYTLNRIKYFLYFAIKISISEASLKPHLNKILDFCACPGNCRKINFFELIIFTAQIDIGCAEDTQRSQLRLTYTDAKPARLTPSHRDQARHIYSFDPLRVRVS
jgi:hypothetical protein